MNRIKTITVAAFALGLLLLIFLVLLLSTPDPDAPRYVPAASQPVGPFGTVAYPWDVAVPFRDGKVWMWTALNRTNHHFYLYDLDHRLALGELFNAGAVFCNLDQTKLLCAGPASPAASINAKLAAFWNRVSSGKFNVPTNRIETFWILDLRHNSAKRLGDLAQFPGTGSHWLPAPGFRYGCNVPSNAEEGSAFFLCDLETAVFTKIKFAGDVQGWWDDHDLLIKDPAGDYLLFDVVTRKTTTLFSAGTLAARFKEAGIADNPFDASTHFNWNGSNYDLYLSAKKGSGLYTNTTFLIKVERPGPNLRLLYREFQFAWLGRLDVTATHYLYPGESGAPGRAGNGGVFLRNLTNGATRTLVEPGSLGGYSLPRFFGESVVYERTNGYWRIDLNGSNNTPAFFSARQVTARQSFSNPNRPQLRPLPSPPT